MVGMVKMLVPLMALGFMASYMDVLQDVLNTVRKSVAGIALCRIDDALYGEFLGSTDPRDDPLPKTREEFFTFMGKAFEDRGSDTAKDQFGTPYYYTYKPKAPERPTYAVLSAGPNQKIGDEDDLALRRCGPKRETTLSPDDIAGLMEKKIGEKRAADEKLVDEMRKAAEGEEGGEGLSGGLDSLLDQAKEGIGKLKEGLTDKLKAGTDGPSTPGELDGSLEGLGGD